MEKDMSQECTKIPEDFHKHASNLTTHWSKLSQATKTTKKLSKPPFLDLLDSIFHFCVSHGLRKKPPAQVKLQTSGPKQQQSLQHSPDLDPTAPITSNIPPREASREPQHSLECSNMEKDMSQECTKIAEDGHKRAPNLTTHWSKLS